MLKVEKWAQGKNPVIAYFAINHALLARDKSEALRHIKERRLYGHQFPLPDFPSWFALYRSRKPIFAYKRLISNTTDFTKKQMNLFSELRKLAKELKNAANRVITFTPQEIEESQKYWQEMCSNTFEEIKDDIAEIPFNLEMQEKIRKALLIDELSLGFYFLVYTPCYLFYEMSPTALYRNALNGDISAIEKLLKVDPLILHDPAIGFRIQSVRLYGKTNEYLSILDAITKQPKINYKMLSDERKSIKSDHGAQIYVLAKALKQPLEMPQIRGLYDDLATDYEGTLTDTDIKKPEGFDKTVKTKAVTWQKHLQDLEKLK
jgi:gas vesicle protein